MWVAIFMNSLVTNQTDFIHDTNCSFWVNSKCFFLSVTLFLVCTLYLKPPFLQDRIYLTPRCSCRLERVLDLDGNEKKQNCQSSFSSIAKEVADVKIFSSFHILMEESKHLSNLLLYFYLIVNLGNTWLKSFHLSCFWLLTPTSLEIGVRSKSLRFVKCHTHAKNLSVMHRHLLSAVAVFVALALWLGCPSFLGGVVLGWRGVEHACVHPWHGLLVFSVSSLQL